MTTAYATSADGLSWDWHGDVLRSTPGTWDQRGARMTTILTREPLGRQMTVAGRAAENPFGANRDREERGLLAADPDGPAAMSPSDGGLRYAWPCRSPMAVSASFEAARPDGAHDLDKRTARGSSCRARSR